MKQIINFDDATLQKVKEEVYRRKLAGEKISISEYVRDAVNNSVKEVSNDLSKVPC